MLRITAPEPVNGRVVGITFREGVAEVDGPLSRATDLYLRTHGYKVAGAEVPSERWRRDDIAAWATSRGIDIEGAETKAELLAVIDVATP